MPRTRGNNTIVGTYTQMLQNSSEKYSSSQICLLAALFFSHRIMEDSLSYFFVVSVLNPSCSRFSLFYPFYLCRYLVTRLYLQSLPFFGSQFILSGHVTCPLAFPLEGFV